VPSLRNIATDESNQPTTTGDGGHTAEM